MLINFSNHPFEKWSDEQQKKALEYGNVVDLPFPVVPADADENDIEMLALGSIERIEDMLGGDLSGSVMVQGEFTLTYAVVSRLLKKGIRVISACSDRYVTEVVSVDGDPVKQVKFCFERFREYR